MGIRRPAGTVFGFFIQVQGPLYVIQLCEMRVVVQPKNTQPRSDRKCGEITGRGPSFLRACGILSASVGSGGG